MWRLQVKMQMSNPTKTSSENASERANYNLSGRPARWDCAALAHAEGRCGAMAPKKKGNAKKGRDSKGKGSNGSGLVAPPVATSEARADERAEGGSGDEGEAEDEAIVPEDDFLAKLHKAGGATKYDGGSKKGGG